MSEKNTGGPAFPHHVVCANGWAETQELQGMTLRDYFAAKALQGLMAGKITTTDTSLIAKDCYVLADAMLAARAKS